jgi:hypothetical protein
MKTRSFNKPLTYKKIIEYIDNIQINFLQYLNKYNENEKESQK